MSGIIIAAVITSILTFSIIAGILFKKAKNQTKEIKIRLIITILLGIPTFYFAFYALRIPLDKVILQISGLDTVNNFYGFLTSFYAPLTEETSKLLILLTPFIFKKINKNNYFYFAFATGLGFGIGEIYFLADGISHHTTYSTLPWYLFTGFLVERFLVTFIHGALLLITLHYLQNKKIRGLFYAMFIHWLLNFPIFLTILLNLGENHIWQILIAQIVPVFAITLMTTTLYIVYGRPVIKGRFIKCPECKKQYEEPFFGIALISKKYEKCSNCQNWHWIGSKDRIKKQSKNSKKSN